jgi:hypothetical protein
MPSSSNLPIQHADHEPRAAGGLEWVDRHLEKFSPVENRRLDEFAFKRFAELTVLTSYLHESSIHAFAPYVTKWTTFITECCAMPSVAQVPRKRPAVGFGFMIPYLLMRGTDYRNDYYEDTLSLLKRWRLLRPVELVPYRALEREYTLWKSGYFRREPNWRPLMKATLLLQQVAPWGFDDESAYAVTHTLFYLTDFGRRAAPLKPIEYNQVRNLVDSLLLHYWRTGNWDLVGELLICLNCLPLCHSEIGFGASRAFHGAWETDGAMPPDAVIVPQHGIPDGDDSRFTRCYHPTLVALLYSAIAMTTLQRDSTCLA